MIILQMEHCRLFFLVINDNSAGKLPYLPFKTSSTKSYLSLAVFLSTEKAYSSFPRLNNLELILSVNTLLLHGLNPRPSLYSILAKNHLNCLQNLLLESLFLWVFVAIIVCGNIFDQRLLFDNRQLCIWPLELSEHYEPRNHSKNQRLKPLRNNRNVSRAKFDVRDFWTCE